MVVAVSGSHGLIGRHLTKRLEQLGYQVLALDRKGNLPANKIDYIFDLAAYGNLNFQTEPDLIYQANVMRLIKLLEQVKRVKGVVLTSSSSVELPVTTFYAASKLAIEALARAYSTKLPVVVTRPATIIGVGETPHHLIPTLVRSCIQGERMKFVAEPTHDFLAAEDFVEALIILAKSAGKFSGKVFNVGSGRCFSNQYIKDRVERVTGYKANIKMVKSLRSYDSKRWVVKPDPELIRLGWKPKIRLEDSIRSMAADIFPGI